MNKEEWMSRGRRKKLYYLACVAVFPTVARATPTVQSLTDSSGHYYQVSNGALSAFKLYTTGSSAGKITSIVYDGQQMVGSKAIYYDIQGSPNIYLGAGQTYTYTTGSNYVIISALQPATTTTPLEVTWNWIIQDGVSGYSTYLTYHHTTAMANYFTNEQRLGAEFFNGSLFHYSSITDNFWGYQAAGNANRGQGRFITAETSDMRGIPSEYIKNYETKYDWRSTYAQSGGVTGIVTAANTSAATGPLVANDYGAWSIENYRSYESWNAGPTHPQTPVADGASIIPSPSGSHFGGPGVTWTGNMDESIGPIFTYFNKNTNVNTLRSDAETYATGSGSTALNTFYDSLNLPYYATTAQRGTVTGKVRTSDGTSMQGATVILSTFDPTGYAADPLGQEYQRRAAGYNYWINPNPDGTFTLPDVRPGTYRLTVIKPGNYREATTDNLTVTAGGTTSVPNFTFVPDVPGKVIWQIGKFDRSAGEFRDGNNYNNWIDTNSYAKEFPNGVNYTVNPANPVNDTANWAQSWGLNMINSSQDMWSVNFTLTSAPASNATVTITVAVADQQFANDLAALVYNAAGTSYNRVDVGFDHTADNAPATYRSGDTSSRVLYRKFTFPGSWLHSGSNKVTFHIVGGNLQWDALNMSIMDPGTFATAQWNGGTGNWTDATQWLTQNANYTNISKGTGGVANSTSTTFADGAVNTAPVNNVSSALYYDAVMNGGTVTLNASAAVQKLSLLEGLVRVTAGAPALTANDAVSLGGITLNGTGTLNALVGTSVNFNNTISGGFKINSSGTVSWYDGSTLTVTGTGSQWNTPALSLGQSSASFLNVSGFGQVSAGAMAITLGKYANTTLAAGTLTGGAVAQAGNFSADANSVVTASAGFTNSGTAIIQGRLAGTTVTNTAGLLTLSGANTYAGATSVTGGAVQFNALASVGGSGASVMVGNGGAVAYLPGITTSGFLARINTASSGALALTGADSATDLNFTQPALAPFAAMAIGAVGNVTYSATYTPSGTLYRLGGGGGTLTYSPLIAGANGLQIGNTGSGGAVIVNALNSYSGATTLKGGTLLVPALANGGLVSPIGSSSNAAANLVIDGGALSATAGGATDRLFTLGAGGATLDGSGSSGFNFSNTGAVVLSGSGKRTLTLTGTGAANAFSPALAEITGGTLALSKTGIGAWALGAGAKSYSGDTSVLQGKLLLNAGASLPSGTGKGNLVIATPATFEMNGQDLAINALNDGPLDPANATNSSGWASPNGPGGGALSNSTGTHTLTVGNGDASGLFSGVISGGINFIKTGAGTQTLSGDNTYTGTTTVNAGVLQVGVGGTPSSDGPGDGGFRGKLGAGNVVNNATLVFNRGYLTTAANIISGTGSLMQIANAELVLGNANTYTGPTLIGDGIANIGQGNGTQSGLAYTGDCALNAAVLANGGAASSIGASSNAAANLVLDGGTLYYSSTAAASTDRLFTVTQNGGAIYASGPLTFSNTGAITMSGTGDRSLSLGGDSATGCTFNADIGDPASGKTTLVKDRSAQWTINSSAALTYSGDTFIRMGTLRLGTGAALPFGAGKGNLVFDNSTDFSSVYPATFQMNGNDVAVNGLSGGVPASAYSVVTNGTGTHTLAVGNNNATSTFDGIITGGVALLKTGTGTQTLTGASTYTGTSSANSGMLVMDGSANSSAITVAASATLSGEGSVKSLLVDIGGTVAPGDAGIGTLFVTSGATLRGTLQSQIDGTGTGTSDVLDVTGTLDISGATLNFSALTTPNDPVYLLATYGALVGNFGAITHLPAGYWVNTAFNDGTTAHNIALQTPEPASLLLLALPLVAFLMRRKTLPFAKEHPCAAVKLIAMSSAPKAAPAGYPHGGRPLGKWFNS